MAHPIERHHDPSAGEVAADLQATDDWNAGPWADEHGYFKEEIEERKKRQQKIRERLPRWVRVALATLPFAAGALAYWLVDPSLRGTVILAAVWIPSLVISFIARYRSD